MDSMACPSCGRRIDEAGARFCPVCGAILSAGGPPGVEAPGGGGAAGAPPPPPRANSVPFEDTSQPFVPRLMRTIGMAFTDPMRLFSSMASGDIAQPLLYGVIVGTVASFFSILWQMLFGGLAMIAEGAAADEFAIGTGLYVLFMFLSPFLVALGLFVSSAIYHVALLILGDGERGFGVTFRAVAYGNTPTLLCVIPFCGGLVGGIWALVLVIIAGKLGHGTGWARVILAYFLPAILCCCLVAWLAMTFGFLGALSG